MIKQYKEHPLNIYRASAGSGKTHLLTGFYIKQLFIHELLPETHQGEMKFSEILAVTFTNKATAEMKERIIEELYQLSVEPQESDYWEDVVPAGTSKDDTAAISRVSKKATQLLVQILNEYASFNISTIDSFFQKIVRSFARELNIPGNYEVELDTNSVLDTAVSNFLDKLDSKQNAELFDWMVEFTRQRASEGSGWDVRSALMELSRKVLESEAYRQHSDAIRRFTNDHKALSGYARMLSDIVRKWRQRMKALGEEGMKLIVNEGWSHTDFKWGGSGSTQTLGKWAVGSTMSPSSRFIECAEDADKMYDTKKKRSPTEQFKTSLQRVMQDCVEHVCGTPYINYCTAKAIMANFYELGIMANIDEEVTSYSNQQNIMLLSSTTEMLSRLVEQDDAPFIYEKTGTRIHSYMIDEFQDTSGMQWGNFKPLVSNALSEGYQNLIVGDVKQSIYRWRGGDWNLLNSDINSYEPSSHYDDSTALGTNWRSLPAIIEFNNDFFPKFAKQLDELLGSGHTRIQDIYADVKQGIPSKKQGADKPQGLVHIEFIKPKDENDVVIPKPKVEEIRAEAARRLPEVIIELQRNGYEARDIAILCRVNNECRWAAESILRYKQEHPDCPYTLDIISNEALQLSARPVIHVLINVMRHLQSPDSDILRAIARTSLLQLEGKDAETSLNIYFALSDAERAFDSQLAHHPLYEMTEALIAMLPTDQLQHEQPFLQAFRDLVLEYSTSHSSDLSGFLNWWDSTGYKKSIATPEGQNAIQIMSVHKSKGLGMPAIIMPLASWEIDINTSHNEILWCQPKTDPFTLDALLPVKLSDSLSNTIFAQDYTEERERAMIDNINTTYVAFTRAKEAMVIMAPMPSKPEGTMLECWLNGYCSSKGAEGSLTMGDWQRQKDDTSEEGSIKDDDVKAGTDEAKKNESPKLDLTKATVSNTASPLPRITILHNPEKPDVTAKERGNYIHAVLQDIRVASDAHNVIERLYMRGDINPDVIQQKEMQKTIDQLLDMSAVKSWFRPGLQVLNEMTLMDNNGQQRRPDRIVIDEDGHVTVIDYKTGDSHAGYHKQVRDYMQLLRQMGFACVNGYLLFLKDNKVVKVKESPALV